jgi:hypothetical protein
MRYIEKRVLIIPLLFVLLILAIIFFLYNKQECTDKDCFNQNLQKCKPSYLFSLEENNLYSYTIFRSFGSYCKIEIKLERMAAGTSKEFIDLLEGKSMTCKIPKDSLFNLKIDKIDTLLTYCSGPLKEALYEVIIKKLYGSIIQQMGTIMEEINKVIK